MSRFSFKLKYSEITQSYSQYRRNRQQRDSVLQEEDTNADSPPGVTLVLKRNANTKETSTATKVTLAQTLQPNETALEPNTEDKNTIAIEPPRSTEKETTKEEINSSSSNTEENDTGSNTIIVPDDHHNTAKIAKMTAKVEKLPHELKQRLVSSLQNAVETIEEAIREEEENAKCKCINQCCVPSSSLLAQEIVPPHFSLPYKIGLNMTKDMLFPALPYFFRDIWIFIELIVTVVSIIMAAINIPNSTNLSVSIAFIVLATLNGFLAGIDAVIYYYELGSYKYMLNSCLNQSTSSSKADNTTKCCKFTCFSDKVKKNLNQFFEVIRTVLSELLLYPLIVFDLFDVGQSGFISLTLEFSIFMISSVYMVLSVYLARVLLTIFTLRSLMHLISDTPTGTNNLRFMVRFFVHIVNQIISHLLCIVAVGMKVHLENVNAHNYNVSVFLWIAIVGGWLVPFFSVMMFFLTHYFWVQQYSIGLYIEMMSLIQVPNIAQSLFKSKSEIHEDTRQKSQQLLDKLQLSDTKQEYVKKLQGASLVTKLAFPGRVLLFPLLSFLYTALLVTFCVSLILGQNSNGSVCLIDFNQVESIFIVGCIAAVCVTNFHALFITPLLPQISLYSLCKRMMK